MTRMLPLLVAAPLLIGYGMVEGWWTSRWDQSNDLQVAASRIAGLPMPLGDWTGQALELTDRELAIGEINGYLHRQYVHLPTGNVVRVMLVCGRPGPISVHTPDVCFAGGGYAMTADAIRQKVAAGPSGKPAEFWMANFRKEEGPLTDPLRVYWAWNATGTWQASDMPRFTFASYPALYKLYVIYTLRRLNEPIANTNIQEFMNLLLPQLDQILFPQT